MDGPSFMNDGFANPVIDMVMDDIVNFNPVHNYFQDMDFSSWDLNFDTITVPQIDVHPSPESTTTNRSKSATRNASRAHAAFKRSPWLWEPGPKDHALHHASPQDKERLVFDENNLANSPAFDKLINTPGTKLKMTASARDSLLALVVASTVQKGARQRTPSFPTLDLLNYLVQAHFIHDEHQSDSWIHIATFDATAAIPELLAGILSSGATYISIPAVWQFGYSLHEVLRLALADLFEGSNTFTRDLGALQAFMLNLDIGIWSGFKRKMEIAESFLQPPMTMLRRAGNFSAPPDSPSLIPTMADPPDVLDSKWRKFAKRESYKRLVLHLFFHDIETSIGFCKNPLMSFTELSFSLPASRDLWRARTAEQWRSIYIAKTNAAPDRTIPRVCEVMHCTEILDDLEQLVDMELCYMALLHGYWGQIGAYREAIKFYTDGMSNKRNTTHKLWLKTQYQELYRDLNDFSTMILTSKRPTAQLAVMSEVLMMVLHVSPDILQTFAGKAGEDEARRTYSSLEESWVKTSEARHAIWHAGQIFHHARQLPPASLRDFNAIAVYFACLTLWAYGLLSCSASRHGSDPEVGSGNRSGAYILMDSEENRETRAFLQLDRGVPGLTLNGNPADGVESLSNPKSAGEAPELPAPGGLTKEISTEKQPYQIPSGQEQQIAEENNQTPPLPSSPLSTNGWDNRESFHDDLYQTLQAIKTPGTFASFHPIKTANGPLNPGLHVADIGSISFPLKEEQARSLIEKARQAPFGKGSDTVVDTTVRNTWELDPTQFELRNPQWNAIINQLCARAAQDMGINAPIIPDLYKLLIYEKGAMFKAHVDTVKIPGMFGTMVVCLPSPHEGGEVVAKHCGETKTLKTSKYREGSVAVWYSDVSHEILPVIWGHRVVLTYNLALDPSRPLPSAGLRRAETQKLRHSLRKWLNGSVPGKSDTDHLYYRLDHEYTEANISMAALKGRDYAVVQTLDDLSTESEFDVFLAALELKEEGTVEYDHGTYSYPLVPHYEISDLLEAAVQLREWEFFEKIAADPHGLINSYIYEWLSKQVGEGKVSFQDIKKGLTSMVLGCEKFSLRVHMVESFAPNGSPVLTDEVREWALDIFSIGLAISSASGSFVGSDGLAAILAARRYADFAWLNSTQFISQLDFNTVYGDRPEERNMPRKRRKDVSGQLGPGADYNYDLAVHPDTLADFFSHLIKLSTPPQEDLVVPLAIKLVGHAKHMKWNDFHPLWLPFLRELIERLESHKVPLTTPRYRQIAGAILEAYRDTYLGEKPSTQARDDNARVSPCYCGDCDILNEFLRSGNKQQQRFTVSKPRRHHLHKQIENYGIRCSHVSDRSGPQDTLVVTKLDPAPGAKWKAAREDTAEQFQQFDQTKLGILLGEDYPRIAEALWERPTNLAPGSGGISYMPALVQTHPQAPVQASYAPAQPPMHSTYAPPVQAPTYPPAQSQMPARAPGGLAPHPGQGMYIREPDNQPFPTAPPARFGVHPPINWVRPPTVHMPHGIPEPRPAGGGYLSSMPTVQNQMAGGQAPTFGSSAGAAPQGQPNHRPHGGPLAPMTGNAGGSPPPGQHLSGINNVGLPPSVAGAKRKAEPEIIDLT
ncbi:Nicotinate catabolism cluster-specific transcription factor [Colletotrichum sp. SAR 10_98]|nr:Nicotinate catabolism cluster-specific transcription factor [Colletotrichum sp. SAR 10_98]